MTVWTTENMPEKDQFSYWREVLCEAFINLLPERRTNGGFSSRVEARLISDTNVVNVTSQSQIVHRRSREIKRDDGSYFFLNLQLAGCSRVAHAGRETLVYPDQFAIVDSTRPYSLDFIDNWNVVSFRIPQHLLRPLFNRPDAAIAVTVGRDSGVGGVLIDFLKSVAGKARDIDPSSAEVISRSIAQMTAVAMGATQPALESSRDILRSELKRSIARHIEENAADTDMNIDKVALRFGVSRRQIQRLLHEQNTCFERMLLEKRLDHCADTLANHQSRLSISEIAFAWGFNDLSHFSRTFRKRFGASPREFRESHHGGRLRFVL
ncbi:helix-turn-helix domain-containing protein (plasmid) [Shinella sp. H4-D48]|uniref:helix-turn-helix domain-containing protein n=1 Tax=Shinella sp. H4-D48 TaxID=2925841 RepID=UPI001F535C93|nr:helix-turn-helix domain-containing protein [Shinella sp. H4-D48]UNK40938.1 helix-turn-helix domain-containing protein [Shinella sp. H4-D48]